MLLPSDVARLVLGYLQEEGLAATSRAFIHESPNLKEYAEHTTADGTIPACVFSVFGKGLTTILNEYVAAKTKDSCHEVPVVLSSLWKKLDFTLNQIKSLQNSPAISANQRTRSRIGVANMARQRVLAVSSATGVVCSTVTETSSPTPTSYSTFSHSTPVSCTALQTRPTPGIGTQQQIPDGNRLLNPTRDSTVQITVSENRLNQGPMSPGRRKWDTPRKRGGGALNGSSGPGRSATAVCGLSVEPQPEEVVDENFPQLVIQNARDKILGDRSLQEKLAENINKILANDPTPQTSKTCSSTLEADQSIDEILGLQGEIHMSDDAIHDILEQTESDPAFQALFDLFDYNKNRLTEEEPGDGDVSSRSQDSDSPEPSSIVTPLQTDDSGTTNINTAASETTEVTVKTRPGQDRKTRKPNAPTLFKKTVLTSSNRSSRIENSSAKLLVTHKECRGNSNKNEKVSVFNNSVTSMEIEEPLNSPLSSHSTSNQERTTQNQTSAVFKELTTAPASKDSSAFAVTLVTSVPNMEKAQQAQGSKDPHATASSSAISSHFASSSLLEVKLNNAPSSTAPLPYVQISTDGDSQPFSASAVTVPGESHSSRTTETALPPSSSASAAVLIPTTSASPSSASTSTATAASPTLSFSAPSAATDPLKTNANTTSQPPADSSNIVSLKIIISENQDEDPSTDIALNQAISSISGDKIPTIYLSSPAKSPACPSTPKINLDEAAQAVSGLQNSEACTSPLISKAGALVTSSLQGTPQAHQSYIIQVPSNNTTLQAAAASYFLVAEPPTPDAPTRQMLLPVGVSKAQPLPASQFVPTPNCSQGYSTGSALILPSPGKPLMLPVSVMGQNSHANVQMMSNQLVAIPTPVPVQQREAFNPKPPTVAVNQHLIAGSEQNVADEVIQPVSVEMPGQKDAEKGSTHRRILNFDSSIECPPQIIQTKNNSPLTANTSVSQSVQQTEKDNKKPTYRTKPTILGGNKPKRRIETVRCSTDHPVKGSLVKEAEMFMHHKDSVKKNSRKQQHNIGNKDPQGTNTNSVKAPQPQTQLVSRGQATAINRLQRSDKANEAKTKDSHSFKPLSSEPALKSDSRKDMEDSSRKEPAEKAPAKSCEGFTEKRPTPEEMPNVTANKENEMKGTMQEQQQQLSTSSSRDFGPSAVTIHPTTNALPIAPKTASKTSSLAKQAAVMLQDIQGINSPSALGAGSADPSHSRTTETCHKQEESAEGHRTPSRHRKGKDGEGTPKHVMLPTTPDVPTCSPASEAGSENSINMAAHTLMILSRAAIARTGTPLKDNLRQEGVVEKSTTGSKSSKKRKQSSPTISPPSKKELKRSPNKKKCSERKKLMDYFPQDLDVDKFLSSLHYDE